MCECGRRTGGWIGLISEVHGHDKAAVDGEYVENLAVRRTPWKALDELVHSDAGLASAFLSHCERFDMGIELTPLPSPIGAYCFFSDDLVKYGTGFQPLVLCRKITGGAAPGWYGAGLRPLSMWEGRHRKQ